MAYLVKSPLKQFIRGKHIRLGFKKLTLAGSSEFCYWSDLYVGKDMLNNRPKDKTLGAHMVHSLMNYCVEDLGSNVLYFDNFFTSVDLFISLAAHGIRATGTLRSNCTLKAPLMSDKDIRKKWSWFT